MVKLDVGAQFVPSDKTVVERVSAQFACMCSKHVPVHCRLFSYHPLFERVEAKTERPKRIRQERGDFSWYSIALQKRPHGAG
jgi:hypothetical protein